MRRRRRRAAIDMIGLRIGWKASPRHPATRLPFLSPGLPGRGLSSRRDSFGNRPTPERAVAWDFHVGKFYSASAVISVGIRMSTRRVTGTESIRPATATANSQAAAICQPQFSLLMTFPCTLQSRGVRQPVRALSGEKHSAHRALATMAQG